jgi:hypothetical protein
MPVESVTYAELGTRLTISPKAARALAKRLRLPRSLSDDGKALVSLDIAELRHTPRPSSRRKGHVVLAAKVLTLEAEIGRLEATAAGHRADFERERERADQLMVELLQTARAAQEATARLEGLLRVNGRPVGSIDSHGLGLGQRRPGPLAAHLVAADRKAAGRS